MLKFDDIKIGEYYLDGGENVIKCLKIYHEEIYNRILAKGPKSVDRNGNIRTIIFYTDIKDEERITKWYLIGKASEKETKLSMLKQIM